MIKYFSTVLCDCRPRPPEGIQELLKILGDFVSATGNILRELIYQLKLLHEDQK